MMIHPRRAFTLIELLVVIVIVLVLIALLLPAVSQAREAARRTQCRNNLMQIGIALQNYELAHRVLPSGCVDPNRPVQSLPQGYHMGWLVQIMPYLEQSNVYNHVDFIAGIYAEPNSDVTAARIEVVSCPSDRGSAIAISNYAGCHHDREAPIDIDQHGILHLNSSVRYDEITDGLGNTIFIGERIAELSELPWPSGTRASLRNTGPPINQIVNPANPVLPGYVGGFSSPHVGGAQFGLGDGSVRFISQNIDMKLYRLLAHRSDGEIISEF